MTDIDQIINEKNKKFFSVKFSWADFLATILGTVLFAILFLILFLTACEPSHRVTDVYDRLEMMAEAR